VLHSRFGRPELGPGSESAKEFDHQENFSAQEALPEEDARVPCPDVLPRGGPRHQAPPPEGTPAPDTRARAVKTKYRLRHSAEFQAVRAERKGAGDAVLRVQVRANSLGHPRIGIVVTKRLGGAVVRNRLRRRLQTTVRGKLGTLGAYDVVLHPQPAAASAGSGALSASLSRALKLTGAGQ
jgi:ribonuclease P protein component